jgi:hypothetical protein
MNESAMYEKLLSLLRGYPIMLQRIENRTGRVPDIYYACSQSSGWIELKEIEMPKRKSTKIKIPFRPGQFPWIKRHLKYSEQIILLCSTKECDSWFIFRGYGIKERYNHTDIELLTKSQMIWCFLRSITNY